PEGVGNAFGLNNGFSSAEGFISGEYYGLILVLILAIVCVQMSTQLIAKLVDRGSMAYLLATPTTRSKVAFTQAMVLITSLFMIIAVTTLSGFAGKVWFLGSDYEFGMARFTQLNTVAFLLFFAIGGLCFLVSCACNDEKKALGISGAITFGFFTIDILAKISDKLDLLRFFTLFSFYRPGEIVQGTAAWLQVSAWLLLIGLACFAIGIQVFRQRDLPLLLDEHTWNMDTGLTPELLMESLHGQVLRMLAAASIDPVQVAGLGIGAVGPLDRKEGVILNPARFAAPGWSQVHIKEQLEQRLNVPVYLDNGANTALLGEYWASSNRMQHHLLYLHAGIGLRSAIMNDGRLLYGMIDTEGAVGQMIIEGSGLPPHIPGGNAGAWESYVSIHTLERQAREAWHRGSSTLLHDLAESAEQLEFTHLIEALHAGDPVVVRLFNEMAVYCGIGLANLINILHPEEVVL
ncbi:hypothetical protein KC345_g11438, partial [Hortaea werneckii]